MEVLSSRPTSGKPAGQLDMAAGFATGASEPTAVGLRQDDLAGLAGRTDPWSMTPPIG